jgi:gas vesicle protein
MCNKCEKTHSSFLKHHHSYNIDKNIEEIFTGLCLEKNHSLELEYFCNDHNKLICAACISKIKSKKNGKHKNCKVFGINKIKDIKKNTLEKNIKCLKELSKEIEETISDLKKLFEKINDDKEKLKEEIQKIFTKIRNTINTREDQI